MDQPGQPLPAEKAEGPVQDTPAQQGVSFLTTVLIAASIAAFSALIAVWYVQTHANVGGAAQKLVFVDGNAIFKAQVKAFSESADAGSPDAAQKAAKEFSVKLNAALLPYKEAGYVVLNSGVALYVPDGVDITGQVAKQVGVQIQ